MEGVFGAQKRIWKGNKGDVMPCPHLIREFKKNEWSGPRMAPEYLEITQ